MDSESLRLLIRAQLARVRDARIVTHILSVLIEPYAIMRQWDYGEPRRQYLCWMVLKDSATGAENPISSEGDWDSIWCAVMQLREDNPGRRYKFGHSISYGEAPAP